MAQIPLELYPDKTKEWILKMRRVAVKIAEETGEVSADDIRKIEDIPLGVKPNALGSLFKSPIFTSKGIKKSTRRMEYNKGSFNFTNKKNC